MGRRRLIGAGLLAALTVTLSAQPRPAHTPFTPVPTAPPAFATVGVLEGFVRDASDRPLPDTRVQARSLQDGHLAEVARTDHLGAFRFAPLAPGAYVVEVALSSGSVVATSEALTIEASRVTQTVVRLPARSRSFSWWLGSGTAVALAQAASLGVLAVDRGQPVSPQ